MNTVTAWQADETCPDCGTAVTLADDRTSQIRADCGSCGYADTWTVTGPAGGDR